MLTPTAIGNRGAPGRGHVGLPIERDRYFKPEGVLSAYADNARLRGRIES
jgi:hypothetical protein